MTTEANDNQALVLQFSADNAKMLRAFEQTVNKIGKYADQIEGRAKKMATKVEEHGRLTGEGFGKALDRVFNASRLTVLQEGAARVSVFGRALEALGPIGLGAAAAVGAFALTMEHTEKAVDYAAGVAKVAKEVGVTTDFIQKFNFAARQNEIDVAAADASLKGLNETLGAVQGGLARAQQVKPFIALGFGKDAAEVRKSLDQYHDIGDFLPVLADRIAKVGDAAQQAAILKKMGGEELLPMLKDGAAAFDALARKAADLGIVMNHATIVQAEEAKKKLTELDDVMKAKANISFAEFAGTLIKVKQAFLDAETAGLRFLAMITGTESAKDKLKDLVQGEQGLLKQPDYANNPVARQLFAHYHAEIQQLLAEQAKAAPEVVPAAKGRVKTLVPDAAKHGAGDETAAFDKSALDALLAAREAEAKATASLVEGIQAHADAEKAAVDTALTKKLADLEAEAQRIARAKNDADKLAQRAKINSAKAAEEEAAETEKRVIDQKAATAALDQFLGYSQRIHGDYARIAANSAAMADTAAERNKIERDQLLAEQRNDLSAFDARAKDELGKLSGPDLDSRRSQLAAERAAKVDANTSDQAAQAFNQAGPLDQYLHKIRDLNTLFEQDGVSAIEQLSGVLEQMGENTRQAGSILEHWLLSLALKVAEQEFAAEAAPVLASAGKGVLAFLRLAGGGQVRGPGSGTSDSIPAMLSDEEYVVNSRATRKHKPLLDAINSGRTLHLAGGGLVGSAVGMLHGLSSMPTRAAGGVTVLQPLHFHAEGAVVTQELLDQARADARREAATAGQLARAGAVSDMQRVSYLGNLNGGG